jgi:helix-turn-helix protein
MSKQHAENGAPGEAPQNTSDTLLADFLTQDKAAAELKICDRTLDGWRRLGEGPPITKLGRRVLYRRSSLQAWLCKRELRGNAA